MNRPSTLAAMTFTGLLACAGFASQGFAEFAIFGYSCDFSGKCAAFETNAGQFALDNVNMQISAVPEPGSWMMLLGGFGTIAAFRRRRTA